MTNIGSNLSHLPNTAPFKIFTALQSTVFTDLKPPLNLQKIYDKYAPHSHSLPPSPRKKHGTVQYLLRYNSRQTVFTFNFR